MVERLAAPDYIIIGLHFVITISVGLWASCCDRPHRNSSKGYFLAGRNMSWWLVGASLFMSDVSGKAVIGFVGAASVVGYAPICYELTGLFAILILGFLFIPVYISAGVYTMPEYLQKRFGGKRLQIYFAVLQMLWALSAITSEIFVGAVITQEILHWNLYVSVLAILGATALYTIFGGLRAVIYTDFLQSIVFVVGATVLAIMSFVRIGGYSALKEQFLNSTAANTTSNNTCGQPDPHAFHIMRPASDKSYPWPGVVFGAMILSTWYYTSNQILVQRMIASKDLIHAKAGSVLAALLKPSFVILVMWPGMVSRVLDPDVIACSTPESCQEACGNPSGCSNLAYPKLIMDILPVGARGMMLAAMLAAMTSSLTSIFNSACTVFTIDIWRRIRPRSSETQQIIVGRISVGVCVLLAMGCLPLAQNAEGGQIMNFVQGVASCLAPPSVSCFLLAVLWKRTNEQGAFWGLMTGFIIGVTNMIILFVMPAPPCGEPDERPSIIRDLHFLHFAIVLSGVCLVITMVVSILTKPIPEEKLGGLTYLTRKTMCREDSKPQEPESEQMNELQGGATPKETVRESTEEEVFVTLSGIDKKRALKLRIREFFLGPPNEVAQELSAHERAQMEEQLKMLAMSENKKWRTLVNASGVFALCLGVFVWGLIF